MAVRKIGAKRKRKVGTTVGKKRVYRRKRVSGMNMSGDMGQIIGVIGGAVASRVINNVVQKQFPGTSLMIVSAGVGIAGYMLPKFIKNPIAKSVGLGMIAMAGTQLVVSTGVISGIAGTGDRMSYRLKQGRVNGTQGTQYLSAIAGAAPGTQYLSAVSGAGYNVPVNGFANPRQVAGLSGTGKGIEQLVAERFAAHGR